MSTYAIGDLQGCFATLQALLKKISFNATRDRLWFVGDLVNRGPLSLECLRFIAGLGDRATTVLGNHDLHLLAVAEGIKESGKRDTLQEILDAPDRAALLSWLRQQPLLHTENEFVLLHAGLLPQWDLPLATALAKDVARALRGADYRTFLKNMYGNTPAQWRDDLHDTERLRITVNAMTRMRVLESDGTMNLAFKGELIVRPAGTTPWFEHCHVSFEGQTILAGHWSALGLFLAPGFVGLDSGCAWGQTLTAMRLEDRAIFQVPYAETSAPSGWD